MKILHVMKTFAPIGGVETYVLKLLPWLEKFGHENVVIYQQEHPQKPSAAHCAAYHIPIAENDGHGSEHQRRHIATVVERERPSVVYLHDVYDPGIIRQVSELVPCVGYVHIFYPVCPGLAKLHRRTDQACQRAYGWGCVPNIYLRRCASARHPRSVYHIMRQTHHYLSLYRSLPRVVVASAYMRDLMVQNGVMPERIEILPPHFVTETDAAPEVRTVPDSSQIFFAGRLEYEKGVPYLLKALSHVKTPYQLRVAGEGSLKPAYQKLAVELGIDDRVEFLGWIDDDALRVAYSQARVTVVPSIMPEPFGKVGIEAMANGCPVVAFDVGGIPDWLHHGSNGYLVPARDILALADRLEQLLEDADLARRLGETGRKQVCTQYDPQAHVERLIEILEMAA